MASQTLLFGRVLNIGKNRGVQMELIFIKESVTVTPKTPADLDWVTLAVKEGKMLKSIGAIVSCVAEEISIPESLKDYDCNAIKQLWILIDCKYHQMAIYFFFLKSNKGWCCVAGRDLIESFGEDMEITEGLKDIILRLPEILGNKGEAAQFINSIP